MTRLVTHQVDSVQFKGRRKTPSELRGEQLKRKTFTETVNESSAPLLDSSNNRSTGVFKKPDLPINPKYIETRLGDVYQVKKPRLPLFPGKENAKPQENSQLEKYRNIKSLPILSNIAPDVYLAVCEKPLKSSEAVKDDSAKSSATVDLCNGYAFRSVAELSVGNERLPGQNVVDMDKALRGLAAIKPPDFSSDTSNYSKWQGNHESMISSSSCPELVVPGQKTPLDLTLKTCMRVVSTSSVSWFHRSVMGSTYNGIPQSFTHKRDMVNQELNLMTQLSSDCQILKSKDLYSWVYPQSSLPSSVITALNSAAAEGAEINFLRKRHSAWEDAFRCLYFMLRKSTCNLFYVCTARFVVMFTSSSVQGKATSSCKAYISRSTKGLRALLKEHDVCFSMPLSPSRMEAVTMDDLVEISELEKQNLGQTCRLSSSSDVDGTPKSLLVFGGNQNVHGLYDFLLNQKSLYSTLTGADVPMLYSQVMFQNASMHTPEFQCKELRKLDRSATLKLSNVENGEDQEISFDAACYSIEVRDTYLPPWITCNLCAIMRFKGVDFKLLHRANTTGLNFALEEPVEKSEEDKIENKKDRTSTFGITNAFIASEMRSAMLKGLKYSKDVITASLTRV